MVESIVPVLIALFECVVVAVTMSSVKLTDHGLISIWLPVVEERYFST